MPTLDAGGLVAPAVVGGRGGWGFHLGEGDATKHSSYEPSRLQIYFRYELRRGREADVW